MDKNDFNTTDKKLQTKIAAFKSALKDPDLVQIISDNLSKEVINEKEVKTNKSKNKNRNKKQENNSQIESNNSHKLPIKTELNKSQTDFQFQKISNEKLKNKIKSFIDNIVKNDAYNDEKKIELLCNKLQEALKENNALKTSSKANDKKYIKLAKEKDQLQSEHNRDVLIKSRLEELCRELQKHNKTVKEESILKIKQIEDKHRSTVNHFQTHLTEITEMFKEHQQSNLKAGDDILKTNRNIELLKEKYEKWVSDLQQLLIEKDLMVKLGEAKLAQINLLLDQEKKNRLSEKQGLLELLTKLKTKTTDSHNNEIRLREELTKYTVKYEEFQEILNKSNEMFKNFKIEIDDMSKQIKELEKETNKWKKKWEESNKAMIAANEEVNVSRHKIKTLESLCRALQNERKQLNKKIKEFEANKI